MGADDRGVQLHLIPRSGSSATALNMRFDTPPSSQREYRCLVCPDGSNYSSRSRQRTPDRAIHNSASMKGLPSLRGPRLPLRPPGTSGSIRAHYSSRRTSSPGSLRSAHDLREPLQPVAPGRCMGPHSARHVSSLGHPEIDSSSIRFHQHAASAKKHDRSRCLARSCGGLTTKIHAIVDTKGLPIGLKLTEARPTTGGRPRTCWAHSRPKTSCWRIVPTTATIGARPVADQGDFEADWEPLFRSFLKLSNGLPSHDTFSRPFRLIDPKAFGRALSRLPDRLGETGAGILAIDGKTLRGSFVRAAGGSHLHVVTSFARERRLVLGPGAVARTFFADPPPELAPPYVTTDADHRRLEVQHQPVWQDPAWLVSDRSPSASSACRV